MTTAIRPDAGLDLEDGPRALSVEDEQIVIGEGVALDVRPAGFLLRAISSIIDYLVAMLLAVGIFAVASWTLTALEKSGARIDTALGAAILVSLSVLVMLFVPVTIETLTKGKSVGRYAMGLRIVRDDGGATGFRHALARGMLGVFEIFMTGGGAAAIVGLMNPRAKRLGDLVAGTYCQNERVRGLAPRALELPPSLAAWSQVADVARLPDRTARRVLDYLDQAPKLEPASRVRLAESVGRECLPYVHPLPEVDADTLLRGVAVLRTRRELAGWEGRAGRRAALAPALDALPHGFPDRG